MTDYKPTVWVDSLFDEKGDRVQKGTSAKASLLNKIEQGIVEAESKISKLPTKASVDSLTTALAETQKLGDLDLQETPFAKMSKKDNEIFLDLNYNEINLDSIVYANATLRDLFIAKNAIANTHFNDDLSGFTVSAGTPSIASDVYNTPSKSLKVFGASSQQISKTLHTTSGAKFYVAVKAKLSRYSSGGGIGFQFAGTPITAKEITGDFITLSGIITVNASVVSYIIGTISAANADGYIDDVVAVNISNYPDIDLTTLNHLYDSYLNLVKGQKAYLSNKRYALNASLDNTIAEADAKSAFISKMNEKAIEIGMVNSNFVNPHGLHSPSQYSTAKDILMLGLYASSKNEISEVWNKPVYTFTAKGNNARTITVTTSVTSPNLEGSYNVFGGKTGTANYVENLLVIVNAPNNQAFVGVVLNTQGSRFTVAKELFDIANANLLENKQTGGVSNLVVNGDFSLSSDWATFAGNPAIIDGVLVANSNGVSSQVRQVLPLTSGRKYYISMKVKCDRHVKGVLGYQLSSYSTTPIGKNAVTSGWETISNVHHVSGGDHSFFVGGLSSADLDGSVDDVVVADLTAMFGTGNEPTKEEFEAMETDHINADKAVVALVPNNPLYYSRSEVPLLFRKKENDQEVPASITKVLTAMVMLDYIKDLNTKLEIKSSDLSALTVFQSGDVVTFKDALHCLMLPSSNDAATAISRVVGKLIINGQ